MYEEEAKRDYEANIQEFENQIAELKAKIEDSNTNHQLKMSSSEKKIVFVEQELSGLHEIITQKDQEISELRGLTYELENYKSLEKRCEELSDEKNDVINAMNSKDKEIEELKLRVE